MHQFERHRLTPIRRIVLVAATVTLTTLAAPLAAAAAQDAKPAPTDAPPSFSIKLDANKAGLISARIKAPRGTMIVARDVTGAATTTTTPGASTPTTATTAAASTTPPPAYRTMKRSSLSLPRLAKWDCAVRDRRFQFDLTFGEDGPAAQAVRTIRTPRCTGRIAISVAKVRAGQTIKATITDRYGHGGLQTRVCAKGPTGAKKCRDITLPHGKKSTAATLGRAKSGQTLVTARNPWGPNLQTRLIARSPTSGFRLLATGDSMIQIIDSYLDQRLKPRKGRVTSDAHISTGISKPSMLNWMRHAKGSAASVKPDVTVVFLGANDGFPMSGAACCGTDWQRIYASRVEGMMRSYLRGGQGRVIWLTLPAPRGGNFAMVFRGVNRAIEQAAARFREDQVTVLDLRKTFTPGGSYRGSITWKGSHKQVRQGDGVHFNNSGASIAAELIISQLRRDGFVR